MIVDKYILQSSTPSVSPYSYFAGDPVNFVDPDGMSWYTIDSYGNVTLIYETKDNFDLLFVYCSSIGPRSTCEDHITVNKSVLGSLSENNGIAKGSKADMVNIFYFAADHFDNQEWGLYYDGKQYALTTDKNSESVTSPLDGVIWKIHSHPDVAATDREEIESIGFIMPSGCYDKNGKLVNPKPGTFSEFWGSDFQQLYDQYHSSKNNLKLQSFVYFPVSRNVRRISPTQYSYPKIIKTR